MAIISITLASAGSYEYLQSADSTLYKFESEISVLPFQKYDSYETCLNKFQEQEEQEEVNMAILEIGCNEALLYAIINYLTNQNSQITISSSDATPKELTAIENLKTQLNLQPQESSTSILSIKNYTNHQENYNLNPGEYIFEVLEADDQYHITIIGHTPPDTINAINKLIEIHNQHFKDSDCVILPDCSLEQHMVEREPTLVDIFITTKKLMDRETTYLSFLKIIQGWFGSTEDEPPITIAGDANNDGTVDSLDTEIFESQFGLSEEGLSADFNNDGSVDLADFAILRENLEISP